jgi:hypothetical protein
MDFTYHPWWYGKLLKEPALGSGPKRKREEGCFLFPALGYASYLYCRRGIHSTTILRHFSTLPDIQQMINREPLQQIVVVFNMAGMRLKMLSKLIFEVLQRLNYPFQARSIPIRSKC